MTKDTVDHLWLTFSGVVATGIAFLSAQAAIDGGLDFFACFGFSLINGACVGIVSTLLYWAVFDGGSGGK